MLPRELRYQVRRNCRRVGEGTVVVPDETIDQLDRGWLHTELRVFGLESLGDLARRRGFVERRRSLEPDREGLDRRVREAAHDADDNRRIHAGAEERAERDVADETPCHRVGDELTDTPASGLAVYASLAPGLWKLQVPVPPRVCSTVGIDDEHARGVDLRHAAVERGRMRDVPVSEVRRHLRLVDVNRHTGMTEERFDLRPEDQAARVAVDEERLLAGTIAGEHEPAGPGVPNRDCEKSRAAAPPSARPGLRRDARGLRCRCAIGTYGRWQPIATAVPGSCRSRR